VASSNRPASPRASPRLFSAVASSCRSTVSRKMTAVCWPLEPGQWPSWEAYVLEHAVVRYFRQLCSVQPRWPDAGRRNHKRGPAIGRRRPHLLHRPDPSPERAGRSRPGGYLDATASSWPAAATVAAQPGPAAKSICGTSPTRPAQRPSAPRQGELATVEYARSPVKRIRQRCLSAI
jgi:hypothetical protein